MKPLLNLIRTYWLACTLPVLAAITLFSLWPLSSFPLVSIGDKTQHLIAYGVLMFPTALRRPRHWQQLCLLFIVWSGLIELIQPYVNRYGEWADMAANTTGIVCGLLLAELLRRGGFLYENHYLERTEDD